MRKRHDYLVGLDAGTDQTRCVVALEEDSHLRFISHGQADAFGEDSLAAAIAARGKVSG